MMYWMESDRRGVRQPECVLLDAANGKKANLWVLCAHGGGQLIAAERTRRAEIGHCSSGSRDSSVCLGFVEAKNQTDSIGEGKGKVLHRQGDDRWEGDRMQTRARKRWQSSLH